MVCDVYRGSNMSAHVLLNFEAIKSGVCRAFYCFFATNLINSISKYKTKNVRFYLSYDNAITLKSQFWRKTVKILSLRTQRFHNVSEIC